MSKKIEVLVYEGNSIKLHEHVKNPMFVYQGNFLIILEIENKIATIYTPYCLKLIKSFKVTN
jgi:hypothetical protein